MLRSTLPVALTLILSAGTVLAQTSPPPPPTPPRATDPAVRPAAGTTTEGTTQAYRAKQVLGTKVSISGDLSIGTVDDVVFRELSLRGEPPPAAQ